jgi:NitT/TauT family transport system permease protein
MAVDTGVPGAGGKSDETTITGLDALELAGRTKKVGLAWRIWAATWPKLIAIGIVVAIWQILYWSGWRDPWVLPSPADVFGQLDDFAHQATFWHGVATTLRRGVTGFLIAAAVGFVVGIVVARNKILRAGIGSMITGLQTMPSIAWFPLAILLFQDESAILFVVILGAAPSIANGVIGGVDYVPPLLLRAGKNIGATGWKLYAYVIAPASLPAIVAGLKQGWAFAWRSLLAGELLVFIANRPSLGGQMEILRQLLDTQGVLAVLIAIFVVGVIADAAFSTADRVVRRRFGVSDPA